MANCVTKHIPNTVTCLNLFSGCVASVMAFQSAYKLALLFIILSAVFDFFDGLLARSLHAHSVIGKDLDSLADDVSFGFAPSVIVFSLMKEMHYPASMETVSAYLPYAAFLISVFSALRLAKFNNDTRQTSRSSACQFRPTPCFGVRSWLDAIHGWCPKVFIRYTFSYWYACSHGYWFQKYRCFPSNSKVCHGKTTRSAFCF